MTVNESMALADVLAPNNVQPDVKRRWLKELEGSIRVELWGQSVEQVGEALDGGAMAPDVDLGAPYPFDRLYWMYLVAMVEHVHGNTTRYTNAAAMFNAAYNAYAKWLQRGGHS